MKDHAKRLLHRGHDITDAGLWIALAAAIILGVVAFYRGMFISPFVYGAIAIFVLLSLSGLVRGFREEGFSAGWHSERLVLHGNPQSHVFAFPVALTVFLSWSGVHFYLDSYLRSEKAFWDNSVISNVVIIMATFTVLYPLIRAYVDKRQSECLLCLEKRRREEEWRRRISTQPTEKV